MGIGRFAFTPILPMMLADGVLDLAAASWLASANYLGYLVGALLCMLQPWLWTRFPSLPPLAFSQLVRGGLLMTGVLTLAMGWLEAPAWPLLRFLAGVTSGVVFVYTSGWCLSRLASLGVPAMGGFIYMGPGAGIVLSGLAASGMVAGRWTAAGAWLVFGALAFVLSALAWRYLQGGNERLQPLASRSPQQSGQVPADRQTVQAGHSAAEMMLLTLAYGLAGFGYIITATFLPVIARSALPGSHWLDLFWPLFGAGVMLGAWLATRIRQVRDFRYLLLMAYLIQALGILLSLWSPGLAGFAIGSLLLGIPFTAITFFAMQEVRRLKPDSAASFIGLMTATYGIGQILGPPLTGWLLQVQRTPGDAFKLALEIAAAALLLGAALYALLLRAYPLARSVSR
jgi:predicted MFS family arabinose efflux permease